MKKNNFKLINPAIHKYKDLQSIANDVDLSKSERLELMEDFMTRKEILSKFKIKQLQGGSDHRYYINEGSKKVRFKEKKDLEDYIVERELKRLYETNTLNGIYESWIAIRRESKSDATFAKDIYIYKRYIKNSPIGNVPLSKLDYDDGYIWYQYCSKIKTDMTKHYFANLKGTLNSMMNYAKRKRIITDNPFTELEIHQDKFVKHPPKKDKELIYSDKEKKAIKQIAYQMSKQHKESKYLAPIILLNTGLRDGELMALRWEDISEKEIHVHAEIVEARDDDGKFIGYKYVGHAKTRAGDRVIPISSEADSAFKQIKKLNLLNGYPIRDDSYVFYRTYKNEMLPCTPRTIYNLIEKMCKEIGMEVKSPHDMRRTCFTNLFYANMPIKDIQAYAGHEDVRMTEKYIKRKEDTAIKQYLEAII